MAAEARINIRVDKDIKDSADSVFNDLGLTMTTAINMFLKRVIATRSIPFSITLDNSADLEESASMFEEKARAAVRKAISETMDKNAPVARYDTLRNLPYLEHPDGRREYRGEQQEK